LMRIASTSKTVSTSMPCATPPTRVTWLGH
jgi:hypothetical protein